MKRMLCICFVLLLLFVCMPVAWAKPLGDYNDDNIIDVTGDTNGDGIISYEEEGELIAMIQTRIRDLGYFLFKPTGRYQTLTRNKMQLFQRNQTDENGAPIIADGTVGQQTLGLLFSTKAVRAPIGTGVHFPNLKKNGKSQAPGQRMKWEDVKLKLQIGSTYEVTDFNTGDMYRMQFIGGEQHAEMECVTVGDTAVFKEQFGNEFNYYKRPVLINVDGVMVAASIQGQPHGDDTVSGNGMTGHACLFFEGSRAHVGGLMDVEHVNNIHTAAGA